MVKTYMQKTSCVLGCLLSLVLVLALFPQVSFADVEQKNSDSSTEIFTEQERLAAEQERSQNTKELGYIPDELVVIYESNDEESSQDIASAIDAEVEVDQQLAGTSAVALLGLPEGITTNTAKEVLQDDDRVIAVEPNRVVELFDEDLVDDGNDTNTVELFSEPNDYNSVSSYQNAIFASKAWDVLAQQSIMKTRVAVIDTGARITHEDLKDTLNKTLSGEVVDLANTPKMETLKGDGYVNGEYNASFTNKTTHGTHVTGIIAASANNGKGVCGVASGGATKYCNAIVDTLAIDAFSRVNDKNEETATVSDIVFAMNDASNKGAKVINLSLGLSSEDQVLKRACDEIYAKGITIVCAAGNTNQTAKMYPAAYDSTVAVINCKTDGSRATYNVASGGTGGSTYGSWCDLAAPGYEIVSTKSDADNSYCPLTGTSMAAPVVSSVAAMMLAVNPSLSPSNIKDILTSTTNQSSKNIQTGWGMINAQKAVEKAASLKGGASSLASLSSASISGVNASYTFNNSNISPNPVVKIGSTTLVKDRDYTVAYKNNRNVGTATLTITGIGNYTGSKSVNYKIVAPTANLYYQAHVSNIGWQNEVSAGKTAGTEGRNLQVEAFKLRLASSYSGNIQVQAHVRNIGWQNWVNSGAVSGTTGRALAIEALRIRLTGDVSNYFDVYYRTHCQNVGWTGWAKNGESSGTAGYAYHMEAVQIQLVPKGGAAPGSTNNAFIQARLLYQAHVSNIGWQSSVRDGATAGTTGRALQVEAFKVQLQNQPYSGSIQVKSHVKNIGWQNWVNSGVVSGTTGRNLWIEALQIRLTGEMANKYDIYYRTHCANVGWTGWAKNGESCGTAGFAYRMEAAQIKLVPKGAAAPGSTANHFYENYKVYITPSGAKYHRQNCPTIKNSKNVQAVTLKQALNSSKGACNVCNP